MVINDLLPPPPLPQPDHCVTKSKRNGTGSRGRSKMMRECICPTPTLCRDLTIQWSRIGEGRYVDYILLPPPPTTALTHAKTTLSTVDGGTGDTMKDPITTKGGKHGVAFRNVVYLGLGYNNNGVVESSEGVDNTNDRKGGRGGDSDTAASFVTENERAVMINIYDKKNSDTNNIQNNNDNNKSTASSSKKKNEFIAMVHFDPHIIPYLRRDGIDPLWSSTLCKKKKVDKWRIPLDVGREIGYTDDYLCPDTDSMGNMTYFAVPNYDLDVAAATFKLAMTTCADTLQQVRNEDAALLAAAEAATTTATTATTTTTSTNSYDEEAGTTTVTTTNNDDAARTKKKLVKDDNPKKMVARMQHINQTNARLKKENLTLRSCLLQNDTICNTLLIRSIKLARVHDRLSQRLDKLEKNIKQTAKKRAREQARDDDFMGKIGVEDDNLMTTTTTTLTKKRTKSTSTAKEGNIATSTMTTTGKETRRRGGSGGKRNSDARMDRAVEAKFHDPSLSAEEALRIGGFVFSTATTLPPGMPCFTDGGGISIKTSNGKDGRDAFIVDTDKISLAQRKNNLLRRLRLRRNAAFEAAATATSAVQYLDNANVHVGLQWGEESV